MGALLAAALLAGCSAPAPAPLAIPDPAPASTPTTATAPVTTSGSAATSAAATSAAAAPAADRARTADGARAAAPPLAAASEALPASRPTRLLVPSIGIDTRMIDLGLRPDGKMEVPADGSTAGWYTQSPTPGELGPAVLAAHVDWKGARGVFHDLRRMDRGDEVRVERADGSTALFAVRRVEQYPKDDFPSAEVYGDVATSQLRLITCGGAFDGRRRSYFDNIVVYAELVGSTAA